MGMEKMSTVQLPINCILLFLYQKLETNKLHFLRSESRRERFQLCVNFL